MNDPKEVVTETKKTETPVQQPQAPAPVTTTETTKKTETK